MNGAHFCFLVMIIAPDGLTLVIIAMESVDRWYQRRRSPTEGPENLDLVWKERSPYAQLFKFRVSHLCVKSKHQPNHY